MENRRGTEFRLSKRAVSRIPVFNFVFPIFLFAFGCGAPGEPTPPSPPVPEAITDLTAKQVGDGVQLSFTLPAKTISGEKLSSSPAVEILRGITRSDGGPDAKSFRIVYTIPGALVENYRFGAHVRFTDPIAPEETKAHPGGKVAYIVRARASRKRSSADSNAISLAVFPVPAPIAPVETRVAESAIELSWPAPTQTSAGDPLPVLAGYRVYRAEIASAGGAPAVPGPLQGGTAAQETALGFSEGNAYRDTSFEFDHTYVYVVRSVILVEGRELESSDSQAATVTPRDTFPPVAPRDVVAAVLPGAAPTALVVDLSWSINLETDLAGYRVYRSEQEGTRGALLNAELLPTPALRDTSVQPGHRYWYTVTAIDRAGNESAPSAALAVDVTQPSP